MAIFNSKQIEKLKKENEELKNKIHLFSEQEEIYNNLEDSLRRIQNEIDLLNEHKHDLRDEIMILENDRKIKESELNELSNKIRK